MAKKNETNKSTTINNDMYDTSDRYENAHNTIVKETITYDNTPIFNKILTCLYIIIALLALNIIMSAINNNSTTTSTTKKTTTTTTVQENTDYDVSNFEAIDADKFVEAYKGDELKVIYLGRANCGFCVKFVPVLNEVQENYDFKTLYLDINNVDQTGVNNIIALNEEFFTGDNTAYGYTPMTLIVKNNEIVDYQVGYSDYSTLEALISKHFSKK